MTSAKFLTPLPAPPCQNFEQYKCSTKTSLTVSEIGKPPLLLSADVICACRPSSGELKGGGGGGGSIISAEEADEVEDEVEDEEEVGDEADEVDEVHRNWRQRGCFSQYEFFLLLTLLW